MLRILASVLMTYFLAGPLLAAQGTTALQALKERQKAEMKTEKLQEQNAKHSLYSRNLPKPVRKQLKHQMAAQEHLLKVQQKQERQALKGQEKAMKQANRQAGFE